MVARRIDRAVQGARGRRAVVALQQVERRAAGEGEVGVVAGDQRGREVFVIAAAQLGQRHRRVDVVEGSEPAGGALDVGADGHALGHVGADHHGVGGFDERAVAGVQRLERVVEHEIGVGHGREVAVLAIPGLVALQEGDAVPAGGEGLE